MSLTLLVFIMIVLALIFVAIGAILFFSTRKLGSSLPDSEQPEWLRAAAEQASTPITSTDSAQERMASPIAEVIEGLLQEAIKANPALSDYQIDLGSAPDGSLEIWVNGEQFAGIDALKDEKLKRVFREVIESFNK